MGLLDDAIRQHLELKRKHGAPEEELERQENEALGPARREVAQQPEGADGAEAEGAAATDGGDVQVAEAPADRDEPAGHETDSDVAAPTDDTVLFDHADGPREASSHEPEAEEIPDAAVPDAVVRDPADPDPGQTEPPPVEPPAAEGEAVEPEVVEPEAAQPAASSGDTPPKGFAGVDPPAEEAPAEAAPHGDSLMDAARAEDAPVEEDSGATQEYDPFGDDEPFADEPEDKASKGEDEDGDVLEDTPDFLQETPEHDRLWFEQKPPRDFDFD